MCIFGIVAFCALLYLAIKICPFGKWVMMAVAFSPNSIAVNSMVSAGTMTTAFLLLYLTVLLRFFVSSTPSRSDWGLLAVSLCGLVVLKMPYICFGLMLFVAVGVNPSLRNLSSLARLTAIGVGLALFGAWTLRTRGVATYIIWGDLGIDSTQQSQYMLSRSLETLAAIGNTIIDGDLGLFQANCYMEFLNSVPSWTTFVLYILAFLAECQEPATVCRPKSVAASLLGLSPIAVLALGAALYLMFTAPSAQMVEGIQSRYYGPLLFPVMLGIYLLFMGKPLARATDKHSAAITSDGLTARYSRSCVPILVVCLMLLYMYYLLYCDWLPF
jgi:uncharacterized membrane protein